MPSTTPSPSTKDQRSTQPSASVERSATTPSHLETERGVTSIDSSVVEKIASIAAREVDGVAVMGGAVSGAIASVVGRIRGDEHRTAGVGVEVGTRQAAVDVAITVHYPASIPQVAEGVRENVIERIESLTGLEVVEVNIAITDLEFPGGEDERESTGRVE